MFQRSWCLWNKNEEVDQAKVILSHQVQLSHLPPLRGFLFWSKLFPPTQQLIQMEHILLFAWILPLAWTSWQMSLAWQPFQCYCCSRCHQAARYLLRSFALKIFAKKFVQSLIYGTVSHPKRKKKDIWRRRRTWPKAIYSCGDHSSGHGSCWMDDDYLLCPWNMKWTKLQDLFCTFIHFTNFGRTLWFPWLTEALQSLTTK